MYGHHFDSVPLTVDLHEFSKVYGEVGETALVDITYPNGAEKALIKEVQMHPVTGIPLHVSFYKVNLKEKITAEVPVEVVGEEKNPLLKSGEGLLLMILNTIEVQCLPTDLPQHFTVDISHIKNIGDGITIGELDYNKEKVELTGELEDDELILKIDYAEMQEEPEEGAVDEATAIEAMEATEETAEDEETTDSETPAKEKDSE